MADEDAPPVTLNGTTYPAFADGKYDVVILGTGLTNSLLAAILAVKKKMSVLHVDRNAYYGGEGASLQLQECVALPRPSPTAQTEQKQATAHIS